MNFLKESKEFKLEALIEENTLNLDINEFLEVALRNNSKREFLFIAKLLGKHLACKPERMQELGKLLVSAYLKKCDISLGKGATIIAFAETATALGHSFFEAFCEDSEFIHTTREELDGIKRMEFIEEHSHAVNHYLYYDNLKSFKENDTVILIDDEFTTGKTCLNIINTINKIYPKKRFILISILNWINPLEIKKFESLNCSIQFVYLFKGNFHFLKYKSIAEKNIVINEKCNYKNIDIKHIKLNFGEYIGSKKYIKYTGRFGMDKANQKELNNIVEREILKLEPVKKKILVLGTEEFMYIPMLFAKKIKGDVSYHSTTRSPIIAFEDSKYPIKNKREITSYFNDGIKNYIYNVNDTDYEEVFVFLEIDKPFDYSEIIGLFSNSLVKRLNIVHCS